MEDYDIFGAMLAIQHMLNLMRDSMTRMQDDLLTVNKNTDNMSDKTPEEVRKIDNQMSKIKVELRQDIISMKFQLHSISDMLRTIKDDSRKAIYEMYREQIESTTRRVERLENVVFSRKCSLICEGKGNCNV